MEAGGRDTGTPFIGRRQVAGVGVATLFSALVSYVVLVVVAHALSPAENAIFLAYWGLLFGVFGVLSGISPETTRATHDGDANLQVPPEGPRLVRSAVLAGGFACVVLAATAVLWASRVLDDRHALLVLVVAAGGVGFSGNLAVNAVLLARQKWRDLVLLMVLEPLTRLVAVLVAMIWLPTIAAFAVASAIPAWAWLLTTGRRDVRRSLGVRSEDGWGPHLDHLLHACVASASSAALVVGFPVLLRVTTSHAEYLGAAGLILAISLTRAPLMVPLNAYQGVALGYFLRHRERGLQALLPVLGAIAGVTVVAAGAAAVVGVWLFRLLLGSAYEISGGVLAGLTAGAGVLALLTMTGASCLAVGGHRGYASGWVVATVASVLLLLVPVDLEARAVLALALGPAVGMAVHLAMIGRGLREGATA